MVGLRMAGREANPEGLTGFSGGSTVRLGEPGLLEYRPRSTLPRQALNTGS